MNMLKNHSMFIKYMHNECVYNIFTIQNLILKDFILIFVYHYT